MWTSLAQTEVEKRVVGKRIMGNGTILGKTLEVTTLESDASTGLGWEVDLGR